MPVQEKMQYDIIWIVWELLLHYSHKKEKICYSIIEALLKIFGIRFSLGSNKKRRYILYFCSFINNRKYKLWD